MEKEGSFELNPENGDERRFQSLFPKSSRKKSVDLLYGKQIAESIDYKKLVFSVLKWSWLAVVVGAMCAVACFFALPEIYPDINKNRYAASARLLYKQNANNSFERQTIDTVKEMITMPGNCQGAKTLLDLEVSVEDIQEACSIRSYSSSKIMTLTAEAPTAGAAQDLVNTLSEVAFNNNRNFYENRAREKIDRVEMELQKTRSEAVAAQQAYITFKNKNSLIGEVSISSLTEEVSMYEAKQIKVKTTIGSLEKELATLGVIKEKQPKLLSQAATKPKSPMEQEFERRELELIRMKSTYAEGHPRLARFKEELENLSQAINSSQTDEEVQSENPRLIGMNLEIQKKQLQLKQAQSENTQISKFVSSRKQLLSQLPSLEETYGRLISRKEAVKEELRAREEILRDLQAEYINPWSDFDIYELAEGFKKASNKNLMASAGAGVAGSFFIIALILPLVSFGKRVSTKKEVELNYKPSCLTVIPKFDEKGLDNLESPLIPYVQEVAEKVAGFKETDGSLSLAFVSAAGGSGKSTIASQLARYYALLNLKTIYLDFDHLSNEVFEKTANMDETLQMDLKDVFIEEDNLTMLKFEKHPSMFRALKEMGSSGFIEKMKAQYDVIILEAPGVLEQAYSCNTIKLVENSVFTIKAGLNKKSEIDAAMKVLEGHGIEPCGLILNSVSKREILV